MSVELNAKSFPVSFAALEQEAKMKMSEGGYGYVRSGASHEETLQKNAQGFEKLSIVPRMLRDVADVDMSVTIGGRTYPFPVFLAPVGMQKLTHEEGELASARAAAAIGVPFVQSTVSSYSIEEIKAGTNSSPKWFQLYWSRNEQVTFSMVNRAEQAGYEAIVLTVDTVMTGWRETDIAADFSPLKLGFGKANYENDPAFMAALDNHENEAVIQSLLENIHYPNLNWSHVAELKKRTKLPIYIKGILHPEDAKLAVENGVDGIIVSNHGGRQLDGIISAIDALPSIVTEVDGAIPVLFDSGIRRGTDVVKALALGAKAVFIGRPFIYGLAVGGQTGVEKILENFIEETKITMSLAGISKVCDLPSIKLIRE
ncbi:alpha-hydroxy-acid oxidizing protein [Cytobacillus purgationiresistens]|uniref:L-lactate oxidase n=1 Tax=Cytobacillus purgationiresistens TaxID=863449 RepID=A0ABU0AU43_9BACI|nr:alpha-hydroxy-acid oxidizing protein [Cytobacillus purgationiresistens]MDQ0273545.1 isopentenyl diphosphate isomerase/L-lactate dehydrogenase-like FMN-dependent dehydrogenase [Cytobacillus purgationiresistens]